MPFSYATAISRITAQPEPVWTPGITSAQQLQQLNMALERLYAYGTWDGLLVNTTVSTTSGVITLNSLYSTIEAMRESETGKAVSIKSQSWKNSPSAPEIGDWTEYRGRWLAFDNGESNGHRIYEIPGDPTYVDTKTFNATVRLRYTWATDANTNVPLDCFQALLVAVRALHWYDVGDINRGDAEFKLALNILEQTLGEVIGDEDIGVISVDPDTSGGTILNLF